MFSVEIRPTVNRCNLIVAFVCKDEPFPKKTNFRLFQTERVYRQQFQI